MNINLYNYKNMRQLESPMYFCLTISRQETHQCVVEDFNLLIISLLLLL